MKKSKIDEVKKIISNLKEKISENDDVNEIDKNEIEKNYQLFLDDKIDPYDYVFKCENIIKPTINEIKQKLDDNKIRLTNYNKICEKLNYSVLSENEILNILNNMSPDNMLVNAIGLNNFNYVKIAINNGADIHYNDDEAICKSVYTNNVDLIKFLIDNGADVHVKNDYLFREFAVKCNNVEFLKYLYNLGADIHASNDYAMYCTPMFGCAEHIKFLVEHGADINLKDGSPIINAVQFGSYENVKTLIELGADIHKMNDTAFSFAIRNNDYKKAQLLLDNGAKFSLVEMILSRDNPKMMKFLEKNYKE